jgi:multicomponent Na+:H+ antiporter subunit D
MEWLRRHRGARPEDLQQYPEGILARIWPAGVMAFWMTIMLAAWLILSYL